MNGIEALLAVLIVYGVRDGVLAWYLIRLILSRAAAAPVAPVRPTDPAPIPQRPADPVPVQPPSVVPKPRFTGITATSFAGGNDSAFSRTSAYNGKVIDGDTEFAAALPVHFKGTPPTIRVFYNGRTADAPIRDVGPWNTNDPYWTSGSRPQAETGTDLTGRKTNLAGLDLSPAVWTALGYNGNPRNATAKVDWDFVDTLDGKTSAPSQASVVGAVPPWLVLMRKLRDMGVHADHDSAIILAWPPAIANKFPEMADYCKDYVHDSIPWCGLTVAYVLAMNGVRPQFGTTGTDRFLWANSWTQFGTSVDAPQPGDVLVFQWAGGGHHVTLYDHEEPADEYYHCTGGNQGSGHVVSTEAMPISNCIAIRRPSQQPP